MADATSLFKNNFLDYSSYVIKERAIPYLIDGFKPVQRRIIHTLMEMDDGKFHKVANVVGAAMKYHPHGDASIVDALVNLTNFGYFIEPQGNFGNQLTGDPAAAGRYIECRMLPLAKKVLYSPKITEYIDSYDGRNKEPVMFPAKLPVVLLHGCKGIAVGMASEILPHNPYEVVDALIASIRGENLNIYPDFFTGGIIDVSEYDDGRGKISIRSKVRIEKAERKIIIEELPYGLTTESLIKSIDDASKKGKIKVSQISDFTSKDVQIEIQLQKNADVDSELNNLFAYTNAELKITSLNPLVIHDNKPVVMGISEIIHFHSRNLISILSKELDVQLDELIDTLQARTLDRIFIEERIYKSIENKKTAEDIERAVIEGLEPFKAEFVRELTKGDVERLLKLPIRRISLFDIEKNKKDIADIEAKIDENKYNKAHINKFAISFLEDLKEYLPEEKKIRKTQISSFEAVEARKIAQRNISLRYDSSLGSLGTDIKTGEELLKVSEFDKILVIQKDGTYRVVPLPDKLYVGKGVQYVGYADKDTTKDIVFTIFYEEKDTGILLIKRCQITQFIMNKIYSLLPDGKNFKLVKLSIFSNAEVTIYYPEDSRKKQDVIYFDDYKVKGVNAGGVIVTRKAVEKIKIKNLSDSNGENTRKKDNQSSLFD